MLQSDEMKVLLVASFELRNSAFISERERAAKLPNLFRFDIS